MSAPTLEDISRQIDRLATTALTIKQQRDELAQALREIIAEDPYRSPDTYDEDHKYANRMAQIARAALAKARLLSESVSLPWDTE